MIKKQSSIDFNSATKGLNIIPPNLLFGMQTTKWRRSIEKIDLLFLTLEALDVNTSQSFEFVARDLEISHVFPNYVAIWKSRFLDSRALDLADSGSQPPGSRDLESRNLEI